MNAARLTPQTVTKHGKAAVIVVDAMEYDRLRRLNRAQAPSFADVLLEMPRDNNEFPRTTVRLPNLEL